MLPPKVSLLASVFLYTNNITNTIIFINKSFVKPLVILTNKLTILVVHIGPVVACRILRGISVGHNSSHRVIRIIVSTELHIENCIRHFANTTSVISELLNKVILIKFGLCKMPEKVVPNWAKVRKTEKTLF